jgi:hypothetical protein
MAALIELGHLEGGDGRFDPASADARAGSGYDVDYLLTPSGVQFLDAFGVAVAVAGRRPLVRYCVDWTEQRHHLGGALGRGLLDRLLALDWVRRAPTHRAVQITPAGSDGLAAVFGPRVTAPPWDRTVRV